MIIQGRQIALFLTASDWERFTGYTFYVSKKQGVFLPPQPLKSGVLKATPNKQNHISIFFSAKHRCTSHGPRPAFHSEA